MLDRESGKDRTALSYAFRPLTKNKYLSKSKKGVVSVLKKGRELFPGEAPLISTATGTVAQQRIMQVARVGNVAWKVRYSHRRRAAGHRRTLLYPFRLLAKDCPGDPVHDPVCKDAPGLWQAVCQL